MEWLNEQFRVVRHRNNIDNISSERNIKKWQPLLDSRRYEFKLDSIIYDIVFESLSEFVDVFLEIDGMRPQISMLNSPSINPYTSPNLYEPEGWIDREDVLDMFFQNLKNYEFINKNINIEIEKEYYNILTGKVTYLLKTDDGLKMDYIVKKEYDNKYIDDILEIVKDTEIFILNPDKRSQIERKFKMKRVLNSK